MPNGTLVQVAGNVGRNPEYKDTRVGKALTFSLAVTTGYGDDAPTAWHDVAVFNEQLQPVVAREIQRGNRVVVEGFLTVNEKQEKTYRNLTASRVGLVEWLRREAGHQPEPQNASQDVPQQPAEDFEF